MRTLKALLCLAAVAAGITTAMAQSNVYSLNVVGYYNITCTAGQKIIIANQLNTTNNTIGGLFAPPMVHNGDYLYKWNGGGFDPSYWSDDDGQWMPDPAVTLAPGEGAFFKPNTATTLTFVGEVVQGQATTSLIYPGQSLGSKVMVSSQIPQQGLLTTDLGMPNSNGDYIWTFNPLQDNSQYTPYYWSDDDGQWMPEEPTIAVGQGFFAKPSASGASSSWVRNFTVQ